jgi:hypothetical protein
VAPAPAAVKKVRLRSIVSPRQCICSYCRACAVYCTTAAELRMRFCRQQHPQRRSTRCLRSGQRLSVSCARALCAFCTPRRQDGHYVWFQSACQRQRNGCSRCLADVTIACRCRGCASAEGRPAPLCEMAKVCAAAAAAEGAEPAAEGAAGAQPLHKDPG